MCCHACMPRCGHGLCLASLSLSFVTPLCIAGWFFFGWKVVVYLVGFSFGYCGRGALSFNKAFIQTCTLHTFSHMHVYEFLHCTGVLCLCIQHAMHMFLFGLFKLSDVGKYWLVYFYIRCQKQKSRL